MSDDSQTLELQCPRTCSGFSFQPVDPSRFFGLGPWCLDRSCTLERTLLHFGAHFVALCCLWTCHCFFWVFPCFSDRPAACEVTKCRNRKRHLKRGGGIDRRPYQDPFCPGAGNEQLGTVSTAHTACVPLKGNSHTWQDANQKLRVI